MGGHIGPPLRLFHSYDMRGGALTEAGGDGLEKIVTLPAYGGRLFGSIDTNTREQDLMKKEPSLVYQETLKLYTTPKGVLIQTENGKAAHITVFSRQWSCLCQP